MLHEAQQKKAQILEELNRERGLLEKKIEELRGFERNYRAQLKSYIESQLEQLDHAGVDLEPSPEGAEGQQG